VDAVAALVVENEKRRPPYRREGVGPAMLSTGVVS